MQIAPRNVTFWAACCIPGVATYAFTLFFCKLVAYTFQYWLPYYINSVTIASTKLSPQVGSITVVLQAIVSTDCTLPVPNQSSVLGFIFCKLAAYTCLYWLPYYINPESIASTKLSPQVGLISVLL